MAKKTKRLFSLVLALSLVMSLMSVMASAVENSSAQQIVKQGDKVYYLSDPQEGEIADENNFDVWTSKTIAGTENEDEFEITLQVGTTIKPVPNDVAVVLVIDASGSMMKDSSGYTWGNNGELPTDGRKLRIDCAREAALEFAEQLVENSGGAQRMLSVVEFGNNAKTVLGWTDANDNGTLNKAVTDAINSVEVNFVVDNCSFWNPDLMETFTLTPDAGITSKQAKVDNWSDEKYTHETENFFESAFESHYQSFMTGDTSEDVTRCTYPDCDVEESHTHCAFDGCPSDGRDHKHCAICGVTDVEKPYDTHCTFDGCTEKTAEHTHCTYSICANPENHTHCERRYLCLVDHDHCWDIQAVCGRTDNHQHVTGCTADFCQNTTPYHQHACVHGGVRGKYAFPDWSTNYDCSATVRCLNPDPNHTHDDYDADSYRFRFDRIHQKWGDCCTNLEGGLMLARNLVNTGLEKDGAIENIDDVYVILLSDGLPTFYVNQDNMENPDTEVNIIYGARGGINQAYVTDWIDVVSNDVGEGEVDVAVAKDIKDVAEFYAILYGTAMNDKLGGSHELSGLTGAEWFKGTGKNYVGADAVFESAELTELNTVFANIKDRIDVLAKAWTVTDELSGDVTFMDFTLNGSYAGYTPAAEDKDASVSWALGRMIPESGSGTVEDPYIYTLKYTVKLNSAQDDVKAASLAYDANPTLDGVWTSQSTQLNYFMVEKTELDDMTPEQIAAKMRTVDFKNVSVKGIYGGFTFVKKNGETGEILPNVGFTLYDSEGKAYGEEVFSDSEGKVIFTGIPRGEYILRETTGPDGLKKMPALGLSESWGSVTGANGRAFPEIIYNWKIAKVDVSGSKIWDDGNDRDGVRPESITIRLYADGVEVDSKTVTAADGWEWSFVGLNQYEGNKVITYTITEDAVEGYTASVSADKDIGDNYCYDVTNTHSYSDPVVPPVPPYNPPVTPPVENPPVVEEEVPDEDVPATDAPVEDEVIEEEDIPMAEVPATGDMTALWVAASAVSAAGVLFLGKKNKDEE